MQALTTFIVKRKSLLLRVAAAVLPMVILLALLAPTVFARTTYVITDGDQVRYHTTFSTNPADVLDEAGFQLGEDDIYTTQPGDGVSEITVQRLKSIALNYCGEQMQVSSYGETLEMLLNRLELPMGENYVPSMAWDTETFDGMEVKIDRVLKMEQSYTVDVPFREVEQLDPKLPADMRVILQEGVNGQMTKTAEVSYLNSQETEHTVISETVIKEPVDQIVAVGTGEEYVEQDSGMPIIGNGVIITADGEVLTYKRSAQFRTTAYSHMDAGCDRITATGTTVRVGAVAVDPTLVPYGTRMFVICNDGSYVYGIATAEDCGGGIKGNQLDLYMPTRSECFEYGKRMCTVYFLD